MPVDPVDPSEGARPRLSARAVIDAAIYERYPDITDSDFPENFGALVEEALACHDYAIVSTASELRRADASKTEAIEALRRQYRPRHS